MQRRSGFTLIELLMVIVILALLIALLLPAVSAVRSNVRVVEVRTEISQLEAACKEFEAELGSLPPSGIKIYEQWGGSAGAIQGWSDDPSSRAIIRGLWPKFDFKKPRDINGDGDVDDWYILKGDQALCFFLGGLWSPSGFTGFSNNPLDPFQPGSSETRIGPFFEFDPSRIETNIGIDYTFHDSSATPSGNCLPHFPVYVDDIPGQTRPYIYVANHTGLGYNDSPSSDSDANTSAAAAERPNGFRAYRRNTTTYWKPRDFQIISPGFDGAYGEGGIFNDESTDPLPNGISGVSRVMERDNITNFHDGMLFP